MTANTILIGATVVLGFYMAWNIGANDVANSMADAVGSRSISIKRAVLAAGIFEFLGAVLVGSHVTDTIRKGIVSHDAMAGHPYELALGMACGLLAAAVWLHFASWWGMPVSTTHSIVGAIAGFGLAAAGLDAIHWGTMGQIVASWFLSPVIGGLMAYLLFKVMIWLILGRDSPVRSAAVIAPAIVFFVVIVMSLSILYKGLQHVLKEQRLEWLTENRAIGVSVVISLAAAILSRVLLKRYLHGQHRRPLHEQLERVERVFAPLVVFTSCCVAFSHGANDVANAIGPLSAVFDIVSNNTVRAQVEVPFWILCLGGTGIVVGLATYGYRVMHTVGTKITTLTPSRGIAADVAATTVVLICSRLKLPVSTTHTLVGAILGVGLARGLGSVDRTVTRNICGSWLITVPAAGGLAAVLFLVARLFLPT